MFWMDSTLWQSEGFVPAIKFMQSATGEPNLGEAVVELRRGVQMCLGWAS